MTVRTTMAALITRVRVLINDPSGVSQVFDDQTIQDVLDEGRVDVLNGNMTAQPTFTGSTVQYLDYFTDSGGWEDGMLLKQYLTLVVTPSTIEPIAGHFQFAQTTLPPVFITGRLFDVYRSAADLLERWAARWVLSYSMTVDGQTLQRSQAATALQNLAHTYRLKQRPRTLTFSRGDLAAGASNPLSLAPNNLDYYGSGDGR